MESTTKRICRQRNKFLFRFLAVTTCLYLFATLMEFIAWRGVEVHGLFSLVYSLLLASYAADNQFQNFADGDETKKRPGELFVYAWIGVTLGMGVAMTFFQREFNIPQYHEWIFAQVVTLFGATNLMKLYKDTLQDWLRNRLGSSEPT